MVLVFWGIIFQYIMFYLYVYKEKNIEYCSFHHNMPLIAKRNLIWLWQEANPSDLFLRW